MIKFNGFQNTFLVKLFAIGIEYFEKQTAHLRVRKKECKW